MMRALLAAAREVENPVFRKERFVLSLKHLGAPPTHLYRHAAGSSMPGKVSIRSFQMEGGIDETHGDGHDDDIAKHGYHIDLL
jgi:hypothetical protein